MVHLSNIGGKSRIPKDELLPICKICGNHLPSFFRSLFRKDICGKENLWHFFTAFGMEHPISYERKNMELVLQVADYFNFEKLDDASPEMQETYKKKNPFTARKENNYTFFCEFNRVYLWGTAEKEHPSFWLNVQCF